MTARYNPSSSLLTFELGAPTVPGAYQVCYCPGFASDAARVSCAVSADYSGVAGVLNVPSELTSDAESDAMDLANDIMAVWDARLAQQGGHGTFLRHLDGNLNNVDASNLEEIHPFDALAAEFHQLGWTVDWAVGLSEQQKEFVLALRHLIFLQWFLCGCFQWQ